MSTVTYTVQLFDEELKPLDDKMWSDYTERIGYELLNINGDLIFHYAEYNNRGDGDILIGRYYVFIQDGKLISVILPSPLIEGLDKYESVKYLEMVKVSS